MQVGNKLTCVVIVLSILGSSFACRQNQTAVLKNDEPASVAATFETAPQVAAKSAESQLTWLRFSGNSDAKLAPFTAEDFAKIEATQGAIGLEIFHSEITDADLESLAANPHIIQFKLGAAPNLTDVAVEKLARFPHVQRISLSQFPQWTNPNFVTFAECKQLKELRLQNCPNLLSDSLAGLAKCNGLQELRFRGCPVSDTAIIQLVKNESLTNIDLSGSSEVTDAGIAELAKLPKLRFLLIQLCPKVTEEGVDALRQKLPQTNIIFAP